MDNEELNKAIDLIRNIDTFERGGIPCGWMPNYTTNVSDAWMLVEEMAEFMDEIALSFFKRTADFKTMWRFEAENYTSEESYCVIADTAPLVIAKCYYKWRTHDRTS